MAVTGQAIDAHAYCREVEAYLCRRNGGHLIRLVGPAFELVCDWARQGIPLTVVCDGIDRVVERAERKGGRRRPLRIEFCEGDVLDGYDRWRRAVGVLQADEGEASTPKRGSLTAHLERVSVQLATLLGSDRVPDAVRALLPAMLSRLDAMKADSAQARGAAREAMLAELESLDRALVEAASAALDAGVRETLTTEALRDLAPFRDKLSPDQFATARQAAFERLVRASRGLPVLRFE
ncbi:MAG: hypothetical protein U0P30_03080 [Vicinamibacterales bacterium]